VGLALSSSALAQIRGSFFTHVRDALERLGALEDIVPAIASSTRLILDNGGDATQWFDEGHAVEIYEAGMRVRDRDFVRALGCEASVIAMTTSWRDMMQVVSNLLGASARLGFEQLPVLWHNTRRDAGEVRCVESSQRHALTEVIGFPYTTSEAWCEVWAGHHDALLRHLRFSGESTIESVEPDKGTIRVRSVWEPRAISTK
jgi:hypothetical protein